MAPTRGFQLLLITLLQILYLIQVTSVVEAIRWLGITSTGLPSSSPNPDPIPSCDNLTTQLIKGQLKFCKNHPEFMTSIKSGAAKALNECQFQFRSRRWNCSLPTTKVLKDCPHLIDRTSRRKLVHRPIVLSENSPSTDSPGFMKLGFSYLIIGKRSYINPNTGSPPRRFQTTAGGKIPIVPEGTREAAFLHAISAAGVAHSVTKQCSAGNSPNCGCDRSMIDRSNEVDYFGMNSNFKWAGCSDNIDYGVSLSRSFVDAKDHKLSRKKGNKTSKALMNLHNNEAGRKIIMRHMKVDCKCHGVSGSCEIKTCWRVMPNFREIGEILRDKFERASHVAEKKTGSRRTLVSRDGKVHADTDLLYVKASPDFCEEDLKKGSLGTRGRRCSKNPNSHDACIDLCCSRGFKTQTVFQLTKCNCKFHWCCNVTCSECKRTIEISTCN